MSPRLQSEALASTADCPPPNVGLRLTAEQIAALKTGDGIIRTTIDFMPDHDMLADLRPGQTVGAGIDVSGMTGAAGVEMQFVGKPKAQTLDELLKHDTVHNMGAEPIEPIAPRDTLHLDMGKPAAAHDSLRDRLEALREAAGVSTDHMADALAHGGRIYRGAGDASVRPEHERIDGGTKAAGEGWRDMTGDETSGIGAGAGSNEGGVLCKHDVEHVSLLHQALATSIESVHSTALRRRLQDAFDALPSADRHGLSWADAREKEREAAHAKALKKSRNDGFINGLDTVAATITVSAAFGMPALEIAELVTKTTERYKKRVAARG